MYGLFVAARGLIVEHLDFGSEAQGSVFLGEGRRVAGGQGVGAFGAAGSYGQHDGYRVADCWEQIGNISWFREGVTFGHVEDHAVGENAAGVDQGDGAVF